MDITFSCTKCGQDMAVDEAGAGMTVQCPNCGTSTTIPKKLIPAQSPTSQPTLPKSTPPADTKKCPFCAETIKAEAKICRFCGRDFVTSNPLSNPAGAVLTSESSPLPKILVVLVIIAVMVGAFFAYNFWKNQQKAKAEAAAAAAKARADITLDGEVFIVTKGGANVKLGLVPVALISLTDLMSYLHKKEATATNEIARLDFLISAAESEYLERKAANKAAYEAEQKRLEADAARLKEEERHLSALANDLWGKWYSASSPDPQRDTLYAKLDAARKAYTKAYDEASKAELARHRPLSYDSPPDNTHLEAKRRWYYGSPYYFDQLPPSFRSTRTDGDGRFQLQVPRSGSWVLAATGYRSVGDSDEKYYWLLSVNAQGESPQKIMLSNDNLFFGVPQYPIQDWNPLLSPR